MCMTELDIQALCQCQRELLSSGYALPSHGRASAIEFATELDPKAHA